MNNLGTPARPKTLTSIKTKAIAIQLGFWSAFLLLIGSGFESYSSIQKLAADKQWVIHTHEVIENLDAILFDIVDTELGRRGYVISGDRNFLRDTDTKVSSMRSRMQNLRQLTKDNPTQQKNLDFLDPLIDRRISILNEVSQIRESDRTNQTIQIALTYQARELRQAIEFQLTKMRMEEDRLLDLRSKVVKVSVQNTLLIDIFGSVIGLSLFLMIYFFLRREIKIRQNAELILRKSNQELYQRQQEFTALVENSPNVIARIDRSARHLYINPSAEKGSGLPLSAFIGKTGREMNFPRQNVEQVEAAIRNVIATGKMEQFEIEQPLPDGIGMGYHQAHIIPEFTQAGEIETMLLVFNDITSNKLTEMALGESNRRWQSLLDNVRLIVVGLNIQGQVEYVNPFFLNSTGYKLDEVLGKDWFSNFLPPLNEAQVTLAFSEILEKDFHPHYQNSILTKDREERMIAWNNTLLQNESGEAIGTLSIGEDITEKLKVDRVKSEFISIVSHELRTPLASIRGALGLLGSGILATKPETAQHMLEIATFDTERLVRLVNDILDLERLESTTISLDRTWNSTTELCQQALETMTTIAAQNQIKLSSNVPSWQIWGDRDRIVQTLVNLLSNAVKFSPPQAEVTLTLEQISDEVIFHVSDRGRGIPANHLERIFERFNQVDASDSRQKGGTGLGLAICRSIVLQHGGKIWVESVVNEGSTFSFAIPNHINFCPLP
jgi:PAS domain S-box-containing protein